MEMRDSLYRHFAILCDASPICMAALDHRRQSHRSRLLGVCGVMPSDFLKLSLKFMKNSTGDPLASFCSRGPDAAGLHSQCSVIKSTLTSCPGCTRLSIRLHYNKNMLDESAALSAAPARVTRHTDPPLSALLIKL